MTWPFESVSLVELRTLTGGGSLTHPVAFWELSFSVYASCSVLSTRTLQPSFDSFSNASLEIFGWPVRRLVFAVGQ